MRWSTVIFGALPASILAFPAALALLLSVGLFQPGKPVTWAFLLCGAGGWAGMISLWIAARKRPYGKRTATGLALGIAAAITFILLKFLNDDMEDRMPVFLVFLSLGPIIVASIHLRLFTLDGGWHASGLPLPGAPPPLPVAPHPRLSTALKGMLFAEVLTALLAGPVVLGDSEGWGKLFVLVATFPFMLAFWVVSGWTVYRHKPLRPLAAAVFILPFLVPPAWDLCEQLMGLETTIRTLPIAAAVLPLLCVILLPRQTALFIPNFLLGSKFSHVLTIILQLLMFVPMAVFFVKLPESLRGEAKGLLVIYAMWHTGFAVAFGVLTLCFGYLGLFQEPPRRHLKLNITELILAILLLAVSVPVGWLILILVSGALVG